MSVGEPAFLAARRRHREYVRAAHPSVLRLDADVREGPPVGADPCRKWIRPASSVIAARCRRRTARVDVPVVRRHVDVLTVGVEHVVVVESRHALERYSELAARGVDLHESVPVDDQPVVEGPVRRFIQPSGTLVNRRGGAGGEVMNADAAALTSGEGAYRADAKAPNAMRARSMDSMMRTVSACVCRGVFGFFRLPRRRQGPSPARRVRRTVSHRSIRPGLRFVPPVVRAKGEPDRAVNGPGSSIRAVDPLIDAVVGVGSRGRW